MYTQKEKDGMAMKNATIDKFASKKGCPEGQVPDGMGGCISTKIKSVDEKNKTYNETSYTKRPIHSSGCSGTNISNKVPNCSSNPNSGLYQNKTEKLKTLIPTFIKN